MVNCLPSPPPLSKSAKSRDEINVQQIDIIDLTLGSEDDDELTTDSEAGTNTNNSTSSNGMESSTSWTEHDAPSGIKYYYNSVTKKSTYTKPACFLLDKINGGTNQPTSDKWKEYTDTKTGRKYFSDGVNTTWKKPVGFIDNTQNRKQKDTKGTSSHSKKLAPILKDSTNDKKHRGGDNMTMSKAKGLTTANNKKYPPQPKKKGKIVPRSQSYATQEEALKALQKIRKKTSTEQRKKVVVKRKDIKKCKVAAKNPTVKHHKQSTTQSTKLQITFSPIRPTRKK